LLVACSRDHAAVHAATVTAASSAPAVPHVAKHDGISVALEGGGIIRETAPYLEPDDEPRPVTFILHGLCAEEKWMCDWLQHGELSPQWQICPRGPTACGNGGAQWGAEGKDIADLLERSLSATRARHGARVGDRVVLAGMSQGAYAIARVVHELALHARPSFPLRGLVLQGAKVSLSPGEVKKLGLRVVLAAGERDIAAPSMRALAAALKANGIQARYASFGDVGHFLPVNSATAMGELIDWARGD
jgi:predicted esterase